jgi:D-inositol-3-phosphate glycosyltransferase
VSNDAGLHLTLVSYDGDPPLGGQGSYVVGLRSALEQRGIRVSLVAGHGAGAVNFRRVTGRAPLDLSLHLARHPELITAAGGDVINAQGGPGGVLLPRAAPQPLVYTAHHTYRQAHGRRSLHRLPAPLEVRAYRQARAVVAVSESTAAALRDMGISPQLIHVIPPGISAEPPPPVRGRSLLLFAGRLEPGKGPLEAVAVMRDLSAEGRCEAVVAGTGSLLPAVARAADGSEVEVRGHVSDAELRSLFGRAAVLLVPSSYEGLGLVALEAMAAGAAVVAYDVDGLRDTVGRAGVLVPQGDVGGLAAAARRLLGAEDIREDLAGRGMALVRDHYSWSGTAERMEQLYRAVLAG